MPFFQSPVFFSILISALSILGTPWIIKSKPPQTVHIYAVDKPYRSIGFISFSDLETNGQARYLNLGIPRFIAATLENITHMTITEGDLLPEMHGEQYYDIRTFPYRTEDTATNYPADFLFVRTNSSPGGTNLSFYMKKDGFRYIDPRLPDFTLSAGISNGILLTNNNGIYVLRETNRFRRSLRIENITFTGKNFSFGTVCTEGQADYYIYGDYGMNDDNLLDLSIYIINRNNRTIELVFRKAIRPEHLYEDISALPYIIIAHMQKKKTVNNITFISEPSGAHIYLDDIFCGKTPFVQPAFPEGTYSFRLWHPDGVLDFGRTFHSHELIEYFCKPGMEEENFSVVNGVPAVTGIAVHEGMNGKTNMFYISSSPHSSQVNVEIGNAQTADIYLNAKLVSADTNTAQMRVEPGENFLTFHKDGFQERNIKFNAPAHSGLYIGLSMIRPSKKNHIQRIFCNYQRNARVSAGISTFLFGGTVFAYLIESNFGDKTEINYFRRQITANDYWYYYQVSRLVRRSGMYAGAAFACFTVYSYARHIKTQEARIETMGKHRRDVIFKYTIGKEF